MTVQFMTVQILTIQIKTGNHGTVSSPHFLAYVDCRQTAGWIKMPFGMEVRLGPDHIVFDGNPVSPLKMICNDFFVVKVNCLSSVFNIMKSILLLRNGINTTFLEKKAS